MRYPAFPWAGNSTGPLWRPPSPGPVLPSPPLVIPGAVFSCLLMFTPCTVRSSITLWLARYLPTSGWWGDWKSYARRRLRRTGAKPSLGGLREGSDRIPSLAQLERAQFGVDFEDAISVTLSQQDLGTTCRRDSLAVARAGTRRRGSWAVAAKNLRRSARVLRVRPDCRPFNP